MRVAFHIKRLNWFRVLSEAIEEALRRGHEVECWLHASATGLRNNVARSDRVPAFRHGSPTIAEYRTPDELLERVGRRDVRVVLDIMPPHETIASRLLRLANRPRWVVYDSPPSDGMKETGSEDQLLCCDKFLLHSGHYRDLIVHMMTRDPEPLIRYAHEHADEVGAHWEGWYRSGHCFRWGSAHVRHFLDRSVIVGNSALDVVGRLDREAIRLRWGIPSGVPVVALLPCPFGDAFRVFWERRFMSRNLGEQLYWCARHRRADVGRLLMAATDRHVVGELQRFCGRQGAYLVAKLRHSTSPRPWLRRASDVIVGEDGYHPHTALELFTIADLTVGYYSSGSVEAVACGSPYLNVEIPFFPEEFFTDVLNAGSRPWAARPGVIESWPAGDLDHRFAGRDLATWPLDPAARVAYLTEEIGPPDGQASSRLWKAVEEIA